MQIKNKLQKNEWVEMSEMSVKWVFHLYFKKGKNAFPNEIKFEDQRQRL